MYALTFFNKNSHKIGFLHQPKGKLLNLLVLNVFCKGSRKAELHLALISH
jgi:hypothetical protein